MLNFEEFQEYVKDHVSEFLPEELKNAEVDLNKVHKNNGRELCAITIRPQGTNISPNVYLDGFFASYKDGADLDGIVQDIADTSARNQNPDEFADIAVKYRDFDFVKDKIVMCLVNAEKNRALLEDTPHTMKEDLALVYRVILNSNNENGFGTVLIKQSHLEEWGVDVAQIHELAMKNSKELLPATVRAMGDVLMEMMSKDGMPDDLLMEMLPDLPDDQQMFVISNTENLHGAASVYYDESVLADLAERIGTDLYILPSSVHETIAVSTNMGDPESLAEMVQEVNEGQVSLEEQLSDHVYHYNAKERSITLADTSLEQLQEAMVSENVQQYGAQSQENVRPRHHR